MATEDCAICGDSVSFATTTHVLVNPKHEEGVADHYVCRPCYDEHLAGLFAALSEEEDDDADLAVDVQAGTDEAPADGAGTDETVTDDAGTDETPADGAKDDEANAHEVNADEPLDASPE